MTRPVCFPSGVPTGPHLDQYTRPTLALDWPQPGKNAPGDRLLVGMHDYGSGLAPDSFRVTADFDLPGLAAGKELAGRFRESSSGVWELKLDQPLRSLPHGTLTVSIQDKQGHETRIVRSFSVEVDPAASSKR